MAITKPMHNAVPRDVMRLLHRLMLDETFDDFFLVGGTGLAMQIGHRISVDIDLFALESFNAQRVGDALEHEYAATQMEVERDTVRAIVNQIKIDVMTHKYALLEPLVMMDCVRVAHLTDIAAMKINAIAGRGSKKDFWDFAALLDHFSAKDMLRLFHNKYPHANAWHAEKSLSYFDDAESQPDPKDLTGKTWEGVKSRINKALMI